MPLNRRAAQHQIALIIIIAKPSQILNRPQTSLPIRHRRIQIMLLALLIHTEPFKCQVASRAIVRLYGSWEEEGRFHAEILHPVFHHGELHRNDTCHLDGAAEGDLAVTLAEMEVADTEFRTGNVHRQEGPRTAGQVLDVAVAAVLGPAWDCTSAFFSYLLFYVRGGRASMHVLWLRGLRDDAFQVRSAYQFGFALVPSGEDFGAGRATEDAGVDETGEADVGNMAGGAEYAFEILKGEG